MENDKKMDQIKVRIPILPLNDLSFHELLKFENKLDPIHSIWSQETYLNILSCVYQVFANTWIGSPSPRPISFVDLNEVDIVYQSCIPGDVAVTYVNTNTRGKVSPFKLPKR